MPLGVIIWKLATKLLSILQLEKYIKISVLHWEERHEETDIVVGSQAGSKVEQTNIGALQ